MQSENMEGSIELADAQRELSRSTERGPSSREPADYISDLLASLGHARKFQRVSRLGSVTARYSISGRQPNFAALNRRRCLPLL